ncbi:cell wall elongation regulator TseB-like domain-containing protein [Oceanobacillus salinisoli]|uniref:cell wall elongation regulator TseB-like domain-containing protein n=1 Tax=Oceanobacillus salinisoli TaxID=2678611 RepID=UPI0018CBF600|nr:DUF5590 domain-containing protein [Oceanobacillus salinisoli]
MKNKRYSQSTGRKWLRKSILFLLVFIIICIAFGIYLYQDIHNNRTADFDKTKENIIKQTSITEVSNIQLFHGDEAYHVVYGKNEENEEKIIFYPLEGTEKIITTVNTSEIISKEEIYSRWNAACENCDLVKITPALIEDSILWEITYYDEDNRYGLDYLSIYDGSTYEQFRFKRMFN